MGSPADQVSPRNRGRLRGAAIEEEGMLGEFLETVRGVVVR